MTARILGFPRCLLLIVGLFLITTHRLPAPIQEITESPAPRLKQATPKPTAPKERATTKPTPTPAALFAGTWVGINGALRGRTVVVNPAETFVTMDGGPWGRESGAVEAKTGSELTWMTKPVGVGVKWKFSLLQGNKTAQLTNKHFLGSETGTFEKKQ